MSKKLRMEWKYILDALNHRIDTFDWQKEADNKSRIKACYSNKYIFEILYSWLNDCHAWFLCTKDEALAKECRLKGNDFFSKKDLTNSLCYYTKAVFLAETHGDELKLAFGNRSAALFELEKYEECLADIKYALPCNDNPSPRRIRLFIRRAKCLERLNKIPDAVDAYNDALKLFKSSSSDDQKKMSSLKQEVNNAVNKLRNNYSKDEIDSEKNLETEFKTLKDEFISNPEFPCASLKLGLQKNEQKGRHVVSKEDIVAGEVLFLEKPYAFVVLPTYAYERCQYCCKYLQNPLPCIYCPDVGFCNEKCRASAWDKFHEWECGFGLNLCYMIGIAHLGLRAAVTGMSDLKNPDYQKVISLQQHIQSFETQDLYHYTLTATMLVIYLNKFTNLLKDSSNREECLWEIGGMILLHIAQMICNGHAITDVTLTKELGSNNLFNEEQLRVATAIYTSTSMMNHSCDPSVINDFKDDYLIVRAIKDIKKGEEVYNCYGPHFRRMPKRERLYSLLQQYMFHCTCEQCVSNEDFLDRFTSYQCRMKSCDGVIPINELHCTKCKVRFSEKIIKSVKRAKKNCHLAKDAAEKNDIKQSVKLAENALELFSEYLYKHHREILECKDFLAQMFVSLGRYYESYKYVEENIEGNKELFGNNSIEVGNEIFKLTDIALKIWQEAVENESTANNVSLKQILHGIFAYIEQGEKIFSLHYGKMSTKRKDLEYRRKIFKLAKLSNK